MLISGRGQVQQGQQPGQSQGRARAGPGLGQARAGAGAMTRARAGAKAKARATAGAWAGPRGSRGHGQDKGKAGAREELGHGPRLGQGRALAPPWSQSRSWPRTRPQPCLCAGLAFVLRLGVSLTWAQVCGFGLALWPCRGFGFGRSLGRAWAPGLTVALALTALRPWLWSDRVRKCQQGKHGNGAGALPSSTECAAIDFT